jgi:hypothetical protein
MPVLLAVAAHPEALAHAAGSGWRTAAVPPDADLGAAWISVADRGGRRVTV